MNYYWYDGQLFGEDKISLSIGEPGLIYGATVFTTLRVYQKSLEHPLTQWDAHCCRLHKGIKDFQWCCPDWERVYQGAQELMVTYPVLRITIFPDGKEWITGRYLPEKLVQYGQKGIDGWLANHSLFQRTLNTYKTGNYLGAWLARQKAQKLGYQEAILVDQQGTWLETSTGNLWGWKEGQWYIPNLQSSILPGIGQSQLVSWLKKQNIEVQEIRWTPLWVKSLEIVAYSNSVVEVIPFAQIDNDGQKKIYNVSHPSLRLLSDYYDFLR